MWKWFSLFHFSTFPKVNWFSGGGKKSLDSNEREQDRYQTSDITVEEKVVMYPELKTLLCIQYVSPYDYEQDYFLALLLLWIDIIER